jgi:cytoskeleton protein RodZ
MAEIGPEIGATLRETRMRARIDIGEVEMRTKIRAKYLRAIENEEWDLLPGKVYVKSFLVTYADYLGLDSRALLDEYKRRYELAPDQGRPLSAVKRKRERERERRDRRFQRPSIPAWAVIVLVLVIAGVLLALIGHSSSPSTPKAARGTTPSSTPTVRSTPKTHVATTTPTTSTTAVAPTEATLKLVPTGSVWVCVETPAGAKLIDSVTETVGAKVPSLKGSELLVTLGNASMTVTANGKPYKLTASSTPIGLKVTPKGVSALPQGPDCA